MATPRNDRGGLKGDRLKTGFDPTAQGLLPRRRPQGPDQAARLSAGHGRHRDLVRADLQEQAGAGAAGRGKRGLSRLLGHRLHPGRSASRHRRRFQGLRRCRACARHEGLYGHHRQPHGRRDPVPEGAARPGLRLSQHRRLSLPRRGGLDGAAINPGFTGDGDERRQFRAADRSQLRLHVYVPRRRESGESPGWLNDPIYTTIAATPTVRAKARQLRRFLRARRSGHRASARRRRADRHLTAAGSTGSASTASASTPRDMSIPNSGRHSCRPCWRARRRRGIPNFPIFGEVYQDTMEPGTLAIHTRVDGYPAVLDFAFRAAALQSIARKVRHRDVGTSCSSATRFMKAVPLRRASCRPSSATMTWVASRCSSAALFHRPAKPKSSIA